MTEAMYSELRDIFITDLGVEAAMVQAGTALREDLAFDSVAFAIGLVAIQERIGVEVTEQQLFSCQTIGDIERLLERLYAEAPAGGGGRR